MRTRCLLAAALLSWSVLPAHAEEGPPTTSPGVPAGAAVLIQPVSSQPPDQGFGIAVADVLRDDDGGAGERRPRPPVRPGRIHPGPRRRSTGLRRGPERRHLQQRDRGRLELRLRLGGRPRQRSRLPPGSVFSPSTSIDRAGTSIPTPGCLRTRRPNVWSHYVVWAHTDNPSIARRFQEAGAPIELIDDYGFRSRTERDDIAVDSKTSPYRVTNNAQVDDVAFGRHDHANEFWFGAAPDAAVL